MISTEQRDHDIHTLAAVNNIFSRFKNMRFLVSGSYAIEALTHAPIDHGDMDTNIFTPNLPNTKIVAIALLDNILLSTGILQPYKQISDRLEYDVITTIKSEIPRKLEIHLIEALAESATQSDTFILTTSKSHKISQVNLVDVSLKDSTGKGHFFKVKSLAYSLATWAIRISGLAKNQLRPVRDSDLECFELLLSQEFSSEEVSFAIEHHPQVPENAKSEEIFQVAKNILKRT
jgi:hypothetical protein